MWTNLKTLTFLREIPEEDLLLRVMGPDPFGAAYYVARVRRQQLNGRAVTRAELVPVPPGWTHTIWRGGRGNRGAQEWIDDSAVEVDAHGYARLVARAAAEPAQVAAGGSR